MRAILAGGLSEATYECYSTVVNEYEAWNDSLIKELQVSENKRAHAYKKLVCDLGKDARILIQNGHLSAGSSRSG